MTVANTPRRAGPFPGDDVTTTLPFSFKAFDSEDVRVDLTDANAVTTTLVLDTDYTLTLNGDQDSDPGGEVELSTPLLDGEAAVVIGGTPYTQALDLPSGGRFNDETIEQALDRLAFQTQQLAEAVSRAASVPTTAGDAEALNEAIAVLVANIDELTIVVDNIADLVALAAVSADVSTLAALTVEIAALASIGGDIVVVAGVAGNVTAVAAISADIQLLADNIADIQLLADNIGTIGAKANAGANADITSLAALTSPLGGFKNLLINGDFRVNQRTYVSGAATGAANQYTLDRWRVVTSGQNLAFVASGSGRQITAPAGGVEQVIEGANIVGGSYTINWTGTATCTVGGVSRAKGEVFTLTAGADVTVRFTGGTVIQAQLEAGVVPTMFEHRHLGIEHTLCAWYFRLWEAGYSDPVATSSTRYGFTQYPEMRTAPTVTNLAAIGTQSNVSSVAFTDVTARSLRLDVTPTASATVLCRRSISLSAEL